jgi:hypothetical protein
MIDGIHVQVDASTGHLRLLCNADQFKRLTTWLREQANVATHFITIPATEFRIVSVELVTEDEMPPSMGKQFATFGCAIAIALVMVTSLVGIVTLGQWAGLR